MDSNDDGIGDLAGITARLDYVASLGVDAIWLSPIYPSPMADFGYDVADYTDVDRRFGSLADFDRLVAEAHRRGLRVILDFVPNHTSDQHPWFIESRSSREAPKRDWYIWRDPAPDGGPPNNWVSYFGSGWTPDPATGQSYFHQFREQQPELNYANPAVLDAMLGVMRFWLDRDVDGFRVDVIALLAKDQRFLDEPPNPEYAPDRDHPYYAVLHAYTQNQTAVHDSIRAMRAVLDEYDDRVMIGELDPFEGYLDYYGADLDEVQLPFNFNLFFVPWQAEAVRRTADAYDAALPAGAWPNWVVGNHDRRRVASRVGVDQLRVAQMLLLTLRGTPFCYYGDEIGMTDAPVPLERLRDTVGVDPALAMRYSRDPQRTPMQWDAGPNAGFDGPGAEPWLPVSPDLATVNVAAEEGDPRSVLALFRRLTSLRRQSGALSLGAYRSIDAGNLAIFAFERLAGEEHLLVALNFSGAPQQADLEAIAGAGEIVVSTGLDRAGPEGLARLALRANEGLILRLGGRCGSTAG